MASLFRYSPAARVLAAAGSRSAMMGQSAASPLVPMVRPMLAARVAPRVGITAFHTTKKLQILPAGPRKYFSTKVQTVGYEGNWQSVVFMTFGHRFKDSACSGA